MVHKSYLSVGKRSGQLTGTAIPLIILLLCLCFVPAAHAQVLTITVDTLIDSNDPAYQVCSAAAQDCSLRGAISKANTDSSTLYSINLPAGTYMLSLAGTEEENSSGDLDIRGSLTLTGSGELNTIIDGNQLDRVFDIHDGATAAIYNVKITGGRAPDGIGGVACDSGGKGGDGGGISNSGGLIISNTIIVENAAGNGGNGGIAGCAFSGSGGNGGNGGGIYNNGVVTIIQSTIMGNAAGDGRHGGDSDYSLGGSGGNGGSGGGIYNIGQMSVTGGLIKDNSAGAFGLYGTGMLDNGMNGTSGMGGGIFNNGTLSLTYSSINNNSTAKGGISVCHRYPPCTDGYAGGSGGGIYTSGTLSLVLSRIENNFTGDGGDGVFYGSVSSGGSGGPGGGIYATGKLVITDSRISFNTTGHGGSGGNSYDYSSGKGGTGGPGGGIFLGPGSEITLANTSILGNSTGVGGKGGNNNSGTGGVGGNGGPGGGVYMDSTASTKLVNTIIAGNLDGDGGLGGIGAAGNGNAGAGGLGGVFIKDSYVEFFHNTIARNTGGDNSGIYAAGAAFLWVNNTVLVGQTVGIFVSSDSTASMEAIFWGSGEWANQNDWSGAGAISIGSHTYRGDPAFVNSARLDFHILATSAAIDRGITTDVYYDIDNQLRPNPNTSVPDLGADEYWSVNTIYLPVIQSSSGNY